MCKTFTSAPLLLLAILLLISPVRAQWCDDFDGGTIDVTKWNQVSGTWSQSGGHLNGYWNVSQAFTDQGNLLVRPEATPSGDYTFDVYMLVRADNGINGCRIVLYNSSGNKYNLLLSLDGNASSEVRVAGANPTFAGYARGRIQFYRSSVGDSNHVRVVREGQSYTISLNGHEIYTLVETLWGGSVSIGVGAYGDASYESACMTPGLPTSPYKRILLYSTRATGPVGGGVRGLDYDEDLPRYLDQDTAALTATDRQYITVLDTTVLKYFDQLWLVSTEDVGVFSGAELQAITAFHESNHGVLLISDACSYNGPANQIAITWGAQFVESPCDCDACGGPVGCSVVPCCMTHPLLYTVHYLQGNVNEGNISVSSGVADLVATHCGGYGWIAATRASTNRVAWDATYYRFTDSASHPDLAITRFANSRYARNLAIWLDCTVDSDGDGFCDKLDYCPNTYDPGQADLDGDNVGDACDGCPDVPGDICYNSLWEASSQKVPMDICPAWDYQTSGPAAHLYMQGDTMVLHTSTLDATQAFNHYTDVLDLPLPLVLEFRMKVVSDTTTVSNRRGISIAVTTGGEYGTVFAIGKDTIFFWDSWETAGPVASVDTDDEYHTYRMIIGLDSGIVLLQDGASILNSHVFSHVDWGIDQSIRWGDRSVGASGESRWLYFKHNGVDMDDVDADGIFGICDNCPTTYNPFQADSDLDGTGDACDVDTFILAESDTVEVFALLQADMDGDNHADFAFTGTDPADSLYISYGKSDGTLESPRGYIVFPLAAVEVGFVNGDTLLDIIARSTSQTKVLLNQGNRNFTESFSAFARYSPPAGSLPSVSAGYFDSDSKLDFLASPDLLYLGDGTGNFSAGPSLPASVTSLRAADLNGDFLDDLVAVVGDSVTCYLNTGSASFNRSASQYLAYRTFDAITLLAADLNRDGRVDIATITHQQDYRDSASSVSVLLGDGVGGIASVDTFSVAGQVASATLSDVDRDKNLDLSVINSSTNRLLVYFGNATGGFPDSLSVTLSSSLEALQALASADLNRDGNPDFVSGGDSTAIVIATNNLPGGEILPDELVATAYSGWNLSVTNPQGYTISRSEQTVAGAAWWQTDVNLDNIRDVRTFDYNLQLGEYRFAIDTTPIVGGPVELDIRVDGTQYIAVFDDYHGYFARARSASAFDSLVFYYTVEATPSMHPPNGERISTRQPVFRWSKLMDSTLASYQVQLAEDFFFGSLVLDSTLTTTSLACPQVLDTGSLYYWRARPSGGAWSRTMVANIGTGCCVHWTANVNMAGIVDGGDLALLVAYLTNPPGNKPALPCLAEANVNAAGIIDGGDLALLVAYLTNVPAQKPSLPLCP